MANKYAKILRHILESFPQADPDSEFFDDPINGSEAVDFIGETVPEIKRALSEPEGERVIDVLREAWNFIENVPADDPERNDKFFELRGKVRNVFYSTDRNFNGERSENMAVNPLIEMIARLTKDGEEVDGRVFVMENDDAVNTLNDLIDEAREIINLTSPMPPGTPFVGKPERCDGCPEPDGEPKCSNTRCCFWPGNNSTWNYHQHGEHPAFRKEDWQQEVANKDTVLDYQSWVEHQLESLLHNAKN
jgi:hypothetical protein